MNAGNTHGGGPAEAPARGAADAPRRPTEALEAKIRANWLKYLVHCAKREAHSSGSILAAIPVRLREEIRAPGLLGWLPARTLGELCEAVRIGAGSLGARTFFRHSLHEAIHQPLMRPLAHGAVHLWGRTPGALARRTPQAWQLVTKNCGELRFLETSEPHAVILRAELVPASCRVLGLLHMLEGGLVAQMDWVSCQGTVETRAQDFAKLGAAEFVIRWTA